MSLMEDIRYHYPRPQPSETGVDHPRDYCIGGACIMFRKGEPIESYRIADRFPNEYDIANILQLYNGALSDREAYEFACLITSHNDAQRFTEAWAALDLAFIRVSKETPCPLTT